MENRSRPQDRRASQFRYAPGDRQDIEVKSACQEGFPKYHGGMGLLRRRSQRPSEWITEPPI